MLGTLPKSEREKEKHCDFFPLSNLLLVPTPLDKHSWHPAGLQARGLTQPNIDVEQSLEGRGMDLKVNKARTGPCWFLIQVLLLTYWENLNKSFSFSDLTSFTCKIKMWDSELLMSL